MTQNISFLNEAELTQVQFNLSPEMQAQAWQQTQQFSTAGRRWNAYLNRLCLDGILGWLRLELHSQVKPWISPTQALSFWEVVDGSAVLLPHASDRTPASTRLVLIPSVATDASELRVPQEWVDLPSWAGDYYLATLIEPDEGWIRIWGFTTHQRLKERGDYDAGDRTYSLDAEHLTQDMTILWDAQEQRLYERTALVPVPPLPLAQAENLLSRLGNAEVVLPRLAVPFALWGALLEHGGWRQQLYQRRLGLAEQWSVRQWLSSRVSQLAQPFGWERVEFQPELAGARGRESNETPASLLSRSLMIAGQPYDLRVIPEPDPAQQVWRFELRRSPVGSEATSEDRLIPRGVKLRLLTEDLQPFDHNEATATTAVERLYVVVALEPGEGLVWEVEPEPEQYQREILRF